MALWYVVCFHRKSRLLKETRREIGSVGQSGTYLDLTGIDVSANNGCAPVGE
jgi:hypothetical protein